MSEPIRVGDLVQVVRPIPCCGNLGASFGAIFRVTKIKCAPFTYCGECKKCIDNVVCVEGWHALVTASRVKRIPPLSELESEQRKEELTA